MARKSPDVPFTRLLSICACSQRLTCETKTCIYLLIFNQPLYNYHALYCYAVKAYSLYTWNPQHDKPYNNTYCVVTTLKTHQLYTSKGYVLIIVVVQLLILPRKKATNKQYITHNICGWLSICHRSALQLSTLIRCSKLYSIRSPLLVIMKLFLIVNVYYYYYLSKKC